MQWKGFVDKNPVLRSIINANADAVTASWRTYGKNAKTAAQIFDGFRGTGKESFKLMMNNMIKIAKIGGDCYSEIVYDSVDGINGEVPTDLTILPSDNIVQIIKNGKIKRYEEASTGTSWRPEEIFHLAYNPIGAMTHGTSAIEPMNNILIHMEDMVENGSKIYEKYVKPTNVFYMNTDSTTEMQKLVDEWKAVMKTSAGDLFLPKDVVDKIERISVPQYSTLDPAHWHRVLMDLLIMGSRVPELALGTGSVNSEESARMQFMGFRQMIRWDQKFLEENIRSQLLTLMFPEDTPAIKWSFATESQDETWNRNLDTLQRLSVSGIDPQLLMLLQTKILLEMGLIPDA